MRKIISFLFCISISYSVQAQDLCSNATALCANNTITATTLGATFSPSDPPLTCGDNTVNNSVWFSVLSINNGTATITVSQINNNPGLEMEVYTGICGSLTSTGFCNAANGPGGSMNVTFPTIAGTVYYIMVDGAFGNQEAFNIQATTSNDALIARPDANFNPDPGNGCTPLSVLFQNTTTLHGGTNITYQWRIDGGAFLPASGADTTIVFNTVGTHTVDLRVCNTQCGCKSISQDIVVQDLFPTISYLPLVSCINSPIDFSGDAMVLSDTPHVDPNITQWSWDFGDPGSGVNNTASGQFITHTFIGPGTTFTVKLVTDGSCGPDSTTINVTLNPEPVVTAGTDQEICEGNTATLTASILVGALPIASYNWVGPGTIGCSNCPSTSVDNLPPGGPYLFSLDIVDANGCTADTTVNINVNAKPVVDPGTDQFTCANIPVTLTATPVSGTPPFTYSWSPATGLDDSTLQSPTAVVNADASYCVTITDSLGCISDAACVNIFVYPPPTISPSVSILCASNPNLKDTFIVSGAGVGYTYSWTLSPDYALITDATADSSSVEVTFPSGVPGTYNFTVIVTDGVTGCVDTLSTSFSVTVGLSMSISGPTEICTGQSATITASGAITYAWTASPSYAFADSTLASQTVSPLVATTFIVTGTAGTCTQVDSITITVNPYPVAVAAPIPDFCGCATVNLDGTGSTAGMSYLWSSVGGALITSPTLLIASSSICSSDIFILTVRDTATGCAIRDSTNANSIPDPVAVAVVAPKFICQGTPTMITLDGTGSDTTGATLHWSSNDPSVIISDTTALVTDATVLTTTVFYFTVTDSLGCDSTASDTVFIYPQPVVNAGPDQIVCEGNSATLIAVVLAGALPIQTFNWVGPGTINCTNCDTTTVDNLPPGGPYIFTVDIMDANGCTATDDVNVTVNSKPTVDGGTDQITCPYQPVSLNATPLTGIPPFTFLWTPAAGLDSDTIQSPTATINTTTSYCVTITDSAGCTSDAACVNIDVFPPPTISPSIAILCATNPNLVDTFTVFGAGAGSTYSWILSPDYSLITAATVDSSSVEVTFPPGVVATYNFTAIVTDGVTTCVDTVYTSFSVTNGLSMSIGGPGQICSGGAATLTAGGAVSYAWTANPPYAFADSTLSSQTVSPVVTTTFTVTGTAGTCSQSISQTLIVNPVPVAVTAAIPDFCGCATVTLNGAGSTPGMIYFWSGLGGATIANPNALNTTSTICASETFVLSVTDGSTGCFSSDTTDANSFPNPAATATVIPDIICQGTPTLITLDGTGSDTTGATLLWTSTDPTVIITSPTSLTTDATVSASTIFYFTVTNAAGCDSTASDTVNVYPFPVLTATPAFLCTSDTVLQSLLSVNGAGPGSTYSWDTIPPCVLPISATGPSQVFDFITCGPGSYNFAVTVTDGTSGCVLSVSQTVTVVTGVALTVSNDTSICEGSPVTLTASGANTFLWSTTDTTASITPPGLTAAGSPYQFTVTGTIGSCTGSDSINVTVNPVPVTGPITGAASVCANDTGSIYSVTPSIGNYNWNVSGGVITSGQGTDVISVSWGATGLGTITVYDSTAGGCIGTPQTLNVTINPVPSTSSIVGQDTVCENSILSYFVLPSAGSTYSWSVTGGSIIGSATGSFISVNWGAPGSGSVSVTETNAAGCSGTTQLLNTFINPTPFPVVIQGNTNLCQGDTLQLYYTTATAGSTYSWVIGGGTLMSGQGTDSVFVNWGGSPTGSVTAFETNSLGCTSDTSTLYVTLNTPPVALIFPDSISVCNNSSYPVSGSVNIGTIHWTTSGSGTFDDTTISSPVYTPGLSDTSYVTLTMVVNSPPCADDTATIVLFYTTNPVITISATRSAICVGDLDTLTATGGGSYLWSPTNDTTSVIFVSPGLTTTYSVTVSTGFTCSTTDSIQITVFQPPTTSPVTGADTVCENDSSVVYFVTPAAGNYSWTVTGGIIASGQGTDSILVNWGTAGAGLVSVVDTNSAGCSGTPQTLNVQINPVPVTTPVTGADTVCENSTTSYFVTSGGPFYNWSVSGGTINGSSTGSFISVTWGTAGSGFVSVTESNAFGCNGVPQSLITVINPVPLPVLVQGNDSLCEGDSIQVYSTPLTAGSSYIWNIAGGTLVSGQGTDSIVVNWGTAGTGSIVVLETNSFGCTSDTSTFNVMLSPHPVASALPDSGSVCQNNAFPVFGSVNLGTIHWITSGTGTFSDTTIASPVYNPGTVDTGYVTLSMILSNTPCPDDTATVVLYISASPIVTIAATQNTICYADIDTLTATGIGNYLWSPGGDTTATIVVQPLITTTYSVTVTNIFSCSTTDSITITVIPPGIPNAGPDQLVCIDDSVYLNGTVQNAGGMQWSTLGDGIFLPDSITPAATYVPGTTDSTSGGVLLVLVSTGACLNLTDTVHISINQFPTVFAGNDTLLTGGPISGATVQLNGIVSNVTGGIWTTSGTGSFAPDDTSLDAVYTPSLADYDQDSVIITLITVGGCRPARDYLVIDFLPFSVPNVFTPFPGSPGLNDYFVIGNLPPGSKLKIWDRWGALVYTSDYYRNDWDAAELKADTYYYALTTDKQEFHGFVMVIRE